MKGWVLYYRSKDELLEVDFAITKLLEVAAKKDIKLQVYTPSQLEIAVGGSKSGIFYKGRELDIPDFIIPSMGAPTSYFALAIVRQLESLGVYACNSSRAIESCGNKLFAHQLLVGNKLPTPKTMVLKFPFKVSLIKREIGLPLIIKHINSVAGYAVYLCETEGQLKDVLNLLHFDNSSMDDFVLQRSVASDFILQTAITTSFGKDLRVFVLGGKVVGCMKRTSKDNFKANFSQGGAVESFTTTPQINDLAVRAAQTFGLDVAGVDLLFTKDGYTICEVNSSPGFKGIGQATGLNVAELILNFIFKKNN